jgi:hypothetical protein
VLLLDVNICLYAMRADSEHHAVARAWLEERIGGHEPVGVSEMVLAGVLRVSTHHRIFAEPSHTSDVMAFCAALLRSPSRSAPPGSAQIGHSPVSKGCACSIRWMATERHRHRAPVCTADTSLSPVGNLWRPRRV